MRSPVRWRPLPYCHIGARMRKGHPVRGLGPRSSRGSPGARSKLISHYARHGLALGVPPPRDLRRKARNARECEGDLRSHPSLRRLRLDRHRLANIVADIDKGTMLARPATNAGLARGHTDRASCHTIEVMQYASDLCRCRLARRPTGYALEAASDNEGASQRGLTAGCASCSTPGVVRGTIATQRVSATM